MLKKLSCGGFLDFYENQKKIIKLHIFKENDVLEFDSIKIIPRLIEHTKGFYFEIIENNKKMVYAPCEYHEFKVHRDTRDVDLFIAHHLFFEDKTIGDSEFDFPEEEDSFEKMLKHAKEMNAKKIIITHIEEGIDLNHDELNKICKEKFSKDIDFGYDGMIIEL
jgi:phosphoribosyl 1,2-cyclic phosphodiesterase